MGKRAKKEELLSYAYEFLDANWASVTKKLGLLEDAFDKPVIELTKKDSEFKEPEYLKINYNTVLKAYQGKEKALQGLKLKWKDFLKDDVMHECVHYLQSQFYDICADRYDYVTEGLAALLTVEIHLDNKNYEFAAAAIADYFIESGKEYKDYFGLPKKYNKHIKKVIRKGTYKPVKRIPYYHKGFMHICKNYGRADHYIDLLVSPFENSDIDD